MKREIFSMDWGKNSLFIYHPENPSSVTTDIHDRNFNEVVNLKKDKDGTPFDKLIAFIKNIPPMSVLVVEDAHMRPRKKDTRRPSKAQPWTEDQARQIIDACHDRDITLKYAPTGQSPRYRAKADVPNDEKSDELDAMCIYNFYYLYPDQIKGLKNPPDTSKDNCFDPSPKRQASYLYKKETDAIMNNLRFMDYDSPMVEWIRENLETLYEVLSEESSRSIFELSDDDRKADKIIKYYTYNEENNCTKKPTTQGQSIIEYLKQNGRSEKQTILDHVHCTESPLKTLLKKDIITEEVDIKKGRLTGKMNALCAILATMMNEDGFLRTRPETGNLPGWYYCKRFILRMTPNHFKGGVARSNLYWHTFKNSVISQAKNLPGYEEGGLFDFKRKVKSKNVAEEDSKKKKKAFPIRRGHFRPEEEKFFLTKRKYFSDGIRKLWQTMRDLAKADTKLQYEDSAPHSEESELTRSSSAGEKLIDTWQEELTPNVNSEI